MRSARMQQLWMKMSLPWLIITRLFDRFIDRGRADSFNAADIVTQEAVITTLANKTTSAAPTSKTTTNAVEAAVNAVEEVEAAGTTATETTGTTKKTSPNTFPRQSTYNRSVA